MSDEIQRLCERLAEIGVPDETLRPILRWKVTGAQVLCANCGHERRHHGALPNKESNYCIAPASGERAKPFISICNCNAFVEPVAKRFLRTCTLVVDAETAEQATQLVQEICSLVAGNGDIGAVDVKEFPARIVSCQPIPVIE